MFNSGELRTAWLCVAARLLCAEPDYSGMMADSPSAEPPVVSAPQSGPSLSVRRLLRQLATKKNGNGLPRLELELYLLSEL